MLSLIARRSEKEGVVYRDGTRRFFQSLIKQTKRDPFRTEINSKCWAKRNFEQDIGSYDEQNRSEIYPNRMVRILTSGKTSHESAQNPQLGHSKRSRHMPETKYLRVPIENFQKRFFYILNPILWFLTCSPKNSLSKKRKKGFSLIGKPFNGIWSISKTLNVFY